MRTPIANHAALRRSIRRAFLAVAAFAATAAGWAQSPRVLNTFDSGTEGWDVNFGDVIPPPTAAGGALLFTTAGLETALSDNFNNATASFAPGAGGVDFTGLSSLEFDLAYDGPDATITVEFFAQAGPSSTYYALGAAFAVAGNTLGIPQTYAVSFADATPGPMSAYDLAYVRTWGLKIFDHSAGSTNWQLHEVRVAGTPLANRVLAEFAPTSPDGGLQGAIVNFQQAAIVGNDGGQNQTGLAATTPAGTNGALELQSQFVDGATGGGAISLCNGFATDFFGRPTDLSNYDRIEIDAAALGTGSDVFFQLWAQTGAGFDFANIGAPQALVRDGAFHSLTFDLTGAANLDYVVQYGFSLSEALAPESPATIQIDEIRGATGGPTAAAGWEGLR